MSFIVSFSFQKHSYFSPEFEQVADVSICDPFFSFVHYSFDSRHISDADPLHPFSPPYNAVSYFILIFPLLFVITIINYYFFFVTTFH